MHAVEEKDTGQRTVRRHQRQLLLQAVRELQLEAFLMMIAVGLVMIMSRIKDCFLLDNEEVRGRTFGAFGGGGDVTAHA